MLASSYLIAIALVLQAPAQAPAGWDSTFRKAGELQLADKYPEAIALLEDTVKRAPDFDGARFELAQAHEAAALHTEGAGAAAERRQHLEAAASEYRRVASMRGQFRPMALLLLTRIYDEDGLNDPHAVADFAREYVQVAPESWMGHVKLAQAQLALGQEPAAISTLLAARTAVAAEGQRQLATYILEHLTKSSVASREHTKLLLDYSDRVLDPELARQPDDRLLLMSKATSLKLRADRVEQSPDRQRALLAEADRAFEKFKAATKTDTDSSEPSNATPAPQTRPTVVMPPSPPGWDAVLNDASSLISRKQFSDAIALFDRFVAEHPSYVAARYLRLSTQIKGGARASGSLLSAARAGGFATPADHYVAGNFLVGIVLENKSLPPDEARLLLNEGIAHLDDALKDGELIEPLTYKNVALRQLARFETDPAAAKKLTDEADRLRARAMELMKR